MVNLINLTQHNATGEQLAAGVEELTMAERQQLGELLTFLDPPDGETVRQVAWEIGVLAETAGYDSAMIGGAPYLMAALERALLSVGITPYYAFSRRESADHEMPDGSSRKVAVFRHLGFVEAVEESRPGDDPVQGSSEYRYANSGESGW